MVEADSDTSGTRYLVRYNAFGATKYAVVRPYHATSADTILAEGDYEAMCQLCRLAIAARDGG